MAAAASGSSAKASTAEADDPALVSPRVLRMSELVDSRIPTRTASPGTRHQPYAELMTTSNFSFLRGGSHREELVIAAAALGLNGLGLCDRNSFAGVVRAYRGRCATSRTTSRRVPLCRRHALCFCRRHARHHRLSDRPRCLWPALQAADHRQSARRERASAISTIERPQGRIAERSTSSSSIADRDGLRRQTAAKPCFTSQSIAPQAGLARCRLPFRRQ